MATLGTLEYLISVNDSGVSSQINKAESKMKSLGNDISAFTIAKGNLISNFATTAFSTVYNAAKDTVKGAVEAFGRFEQLEGGIRKLFGPDVKTEVVNNARNAFKTAGMSANEYMELVTDFSASLISSLNGDASKAAKVADMAIQDMADNANTFGTSMDSIQNAYKGFSKQNYTMLDNLKLGYGGTRKEMQRLLKDAEKIQKQQGKNTKYSINNLNDIYEAIHVIQESMNISGTTKNEAEGTIEGSIASAKAAWDNVLTALGSGRNVQDTVKSFAGTLKTVFKNVTPVAIEAVRGLFEGAKTLLPEIGNIAVGVLDQIGRSIFGDETWDITINWIQNAWETVKGAFNTAKDWVDKAFTTTVEWVQNAWETVGNAFTELGEWANKAFTTTVNFVRGTWENVKNAISDVGKKIWNNTVNFFIGTYETVRNFISDVGKKIWNNTVNFFIGTYETVRNFIGDVGKKIWNNTVNFFLETWDAVSNAIKDVGKGVWDNTVNFALGLWEGVQKFMDSIPEAINVAVNFVKHVIDSGTNDTGTFQGGEPSGLGWGESFDVPEVPGWNAKGMWNVPYDNYPSYLHRGEMVLSASQARKFRNNTSSGLDYDTVGEIIGDAIKESMGKINVYLSADKVGNLTTKIINKNIQASSNARLHAMGG